MEDQMDNQMQMIRYNAPQYLVEPYGDVIEGEALDLELSELDAITAVEEATGWQPYTHIVTGVIRSSDPNDGDWYITYLSTFDPRKEE
jgi:hypothetical protein